LSDKATQFRGDNSEFVRPINELYAILKRHTNHVRTLETYITKLKHILPTFFIIALSTIIGLLLFRWIFAIQFDIIDIKEEVWCFWLPMGLPWIPILIWLRPRLRILTFKKDNDNGRFFFQFISAGTIISCLLVSQNYLTTATGKLQQLSNIKEIDKVENSRYYKLDNFSVVPYFGGSYTDFRTSGKYNQTLNFDIFFVTPILNANSERISNIPKHWYGVNFKEQISNKISNEEKEKKYKAFYNECIEKMNKYEFHSLDHFERKPTSDDRQNYLKAIESRIKQTAGNDFVVLEPIQEKFEDRNGNKFAWIFGSFGIGLGVLLFSIIWPGYSEIERNRFLTGKKPKQDDLVDMLYYLVPKGDHFATSIILDLNILAFLLMVFSGINILSPNGIELLQWGANRRLETTDGEWWRLLTSMFLHGGIMHLILNISGLVIAAIFVEPLLGRKNYFILYILSGICGSVASIWWYPNTISVGASGAIFGLYGAILGLLLTNAFPEGGKKGILMMIGIYVGINLLWGLTGGIDNAAHIGGLLSGALIGLILYKLDNGQKNGI
jgi:rhomboid protease GluP